MTHRVNDIRAVLFDADGVLQRMAPGWLDNVKRLCGDASQAEHFIQDIFQAEQPCLRGEGDFKQALAENLFKWGSETAIEDALRVWMMIEPDAEAFRLVRRIRANGVIVGLATNQQNQRAHHMLEVLGYKHEFDYVFCSCRMGVVKPTAAYFQSAMDALGLEAGCVVFIDDHETNVAAAEAMGLRGIRFHLDQGVAELERKLGEFGL